MVPAAAFCPCGRNLPLYIAPAASILRAKNTAGLVPLEEYVNERAQQFVEGFRATA